MEERRIKIIKSFVFHRRKKYDLNKHGGANIPPTSVLIKLFV